MQCSESAEDIQSSDKFSTRRSSWQTVFKVANMKETTHQECQSRVTFTEKPKDDIIKHCVIIAKSWKWVAESMNMQLISQDTDNRGARGWPHSTNIQYLNLFRS